MNNDQSSLEQEHSNVHFIYDYTKHHYAMVNNSLDILTVKINLVLGLTAGLIGLGLSTTSKQAVVSLLPRYWMTFEIVAIVLCATALCLCFVGLQPKATGMVISPKGLMDEHYYSSGEECHLVVIELLIKSLPELEELRNWKAGIVKHATRLLCAAIACKTISWVACACAMFSNIN